jgi:hypothetical protein
LVEGTCLPEALYQATAELPSLSSEGKLVSDQIYSGQAMLRGLQAEGSTDLSTRILTGAAEMPALGAEGAIATGGMFLGEAELLGLRVEGRLTRIWQAESLTGEAQLLPLEAEGLTDGSTGPMTGVVVIPGIVVDDARLITENDFHVLQYKRYRQWQSWFSR